ncbi:RNA polymerase II mediator complex subunit [Loxospora ochrophaea]|nr:RNA polymerase II mediator complex subunit [Loxospora ochrophaea]
MADKLTQLQDCLDQLSTQLYASLRYITTHHPTPSPSQSTATTAASPPSQPPPQNPHSPSRPDTPTTFSLSTKELAHDLVLKTQQIEYLVRTLPGIETSEVQQEARIKALEEELRVAERERREVVGVKEELVRRVEGVIGALGGGREEREVGVP